MQKFKILLVDDEEHQREPIRGFLSKKGYDVNAAASVNEALSYFALNPVDIVITDFKMPDKTGADLLSECKKNQSFDTCCSNDCLR